MAAPEVINVTTDYEDPMQFESLCMECMNNVRSQACPNISAEPCISLLEAREHV